MALVLAVVSLALIGALVYSMHRAAEDRKEWALERGALLQRIQAPEIAVRQFDERPKRKAPLPLPIDDDKAHKEARERRMSGNVD